MGLFTKWLKNPFVMMALNSSPKGRVAKAVLVGVDTTFEEIQKKKAGESDYMDLSLALGEVGAEVAPKFKVNIVNDKLQSTLGIGTKDALSRLRDMKKNASAGSLEEIKASARLAAAKRLADIDEYDDEDDDD